VKGKPERLPTKSDAKLRPTAEWKVAVDLSEGDVPKPGAPRYHRIDDTAHDVRQRLSRRIDGLLRDTARVKGQGGGTL
jgi:hypothetical protein